MAKTNEDRTRVPKGLRGLWRHMNYCGVFIYTDLDFAFLSNCEEYYFIENLLFIMSQTEFRLVHNQKQIVFTMIFVSKLKGN